MSLSILHEYTHTQNETYHAKTGEAETEARKGASRFSAYWSISNQPSLHVEKNGVRKCVRERERRVHDGPTLNIVL